MRSFILFCVFLFGITKITQINDIIDKDIMALLHSIHQPSLDANIADIGNVPIKSLNQTDVANYIYSIFRHIQWFEYVRELDLKQIEDTKRLLDECYIIHPECDNN